MEARLLSKKQEERKQRIEQLCNRYREYLRDYPAEAPTHIMRVMAERQEEGYKSAAGIRNVLMRNGFNVRGNG